MIEHGYETLETNRTASLKRISWGAVFAGVVVALVTQFLLSLLGLGIGASTINPVSEQEPAAGIGLGAGIWFVVSSLLAFFAGGWVAGRLAGQPEKTESALHGVLTWGSATLITLFLLTSAIGGLLSGAAGVLGKGLSLATQSVSSSPDLASQLLSQTGVTNLAAITNVTTTGVSEGEAREMAESAASTVSKAAIWTFITFLLGGAAAAAGGRFGAPHELAVARPAQRLAA